MALQGTALQQKVSRLLSRQMGKPALKPNKPLALRDEVANRKPSKGEASCIPEMYLLMACWKKNDFSDALCSKEVETFHKCTQRAQAEMRARLAQEGGQGGRLHPKQANTLLKRHPNLFSEI
ncbi:coiled-coil-helix-coiled-coil-helix domain-containing protein 1 [Megalops cyprinoides]|uniref:coiled-coil-helix-coiled-coil-helix domain-containing protein 1 n=1 Tax=Megalops cyprinoides TaxID=118141 RepID=UPI00186500CC|nr:coiled-coil-helix-coiled-coil-helix domain-containing protein 1 [Megalops cyprinoides]